jgi:hypothetical protein
VVEFPVWGAPGEGLLEVAYRAGGRRIFDSSNTPRFGGDPVFEEIVEWHAQAYRGDQFFGSTADVQAPFDDRKTSFTWTSFSELKRLNGRASRAGAGRAGGGAASRLLHAADPSFVAGQTGGSGIRRPYAVAASSVHPLEAWRLSPSLGAGTAPGGTPWPGGGGSSRVCGSGTSPWSKTRT